MHEIDQQIDNDYEDEQIKTETHTTGRKKG